MRKSLFITMILVVLVLLFGCSNTDTTSTTSPAENAPQNPLPPTPFLSVSTPSPMLEDKSSPRIDISPEYSDDNMQATVYVGTYNEPSSTPELAYQLTIWSESYYWEDKPFVENGVVMGEIGLFARAFNCEYNIENDATYHLVINTEKEFVFSIDSNLAALNGERVLLESPTIHNKNRLANENGKLYIPLRCVAELIGLYTRQLYNSESNEQTLWLSECAVLDDKEFIPDNNYEFEATGEWHLDGYTGIYFNRYQLKETSHTYSGVKIGDSIDEVIEVLGAPQYKDAEISSMDHFPGNSRFIYYREPQYNSDFPDSFEIFFEDDMVCEININLGIWDD